MSFVVFLSTASMSWVYPGKQVYTVCGTFCGATDSRCMDTCAIKTSIIKLVDMGMEPRLAAESITSVSCENKTCSVSLEYEDDFGAGRLASTLY